LAAIHRENEAHLDIKPSNIIREKADADGKRRVVIVDLANARKVPGPHVHLKGSRLYQAPEQLLGLTTQGGTRVDIYAMGVILYQYLTFRHPFDDSDKGWDNMTVDERDAYEPKLIKNIRTKKVENPRHFDEKVPMTMANININMLKPVPDQRPRADTLVNTFFSLRRRLAGKR
jgi:serine/threonine protein kinase